MNIKINNLFNNIFNRNKEILVQINTDENIKKCCENCEHKRRAGALLNEYKCEILKIRIKNIWICDNHKFSKEFIGLYNNNLKTKEANLIKRQDNKRPKVYNK